MFHFHKFISSVLLICWLSQVLRKQRMRVKVLWIWSISYIVMMKLTCSHWRHRNHKKNQGYGPPLFPDPLGLVGMFWSDHFWTPQWAFHAIPWVPNSLGIILASLFNTSPHFFWLTISPGPFSPAFWHLYLLLWFLPQWKCWPRHLSRLALIFWPTLR